MPVALEYDPKAGLWTLTSGEMFDLAEVADLIEKTDWKAARRFLWDFRGLTKGPDSSVELRDAVDLVNRTRDLWAGSQTAIVVARDLDFGIARMFSAFAEQVDVEYQVFRDEDAARQWLGSAAD